MKVKKIGTGEYRVYIVWAYRNGAYIDDLEVRYAKRYDAEDYRIRCGGEIGWEDFTDRDEAQTFLNEKMGKIWW